ncbi:MULTISPECIES: 50S ribosomal protein L25/general stress protein Ctc [unclassified Azospirillum]|jgi:large subunit ribosomal protein L25|uniref:50S ribosomal protein L25/general stress protein Ctc n=1 Tax=unclassified Azospirillum TaxID=2630922 RepID=UPI000B6779C7|nr:MULTISPECIES: 50S ribosomal protein L25/general stress protein Ctc [unclassified Azospirillum]SNS42719.1 LSU ribosomal protein L25P [Azospirillum sp. RU38E]SNS61425.1 LSU ribosomal protein L25P [Azospirillum sp. RU37A]
MTQIIALAATARDRAGKGTARATRRDGRIPAVIYGNKEKPVMIALDTTKFTRELHRPGFFTHLFDIELDGVKHRVLPRDVQLDPVYDRPLHVDFLRVSDTTEITLKVPVEFVNVETCPGIKRGGMLNIVRHDIEVYARAAAIPEKITVDLAGVDVGASIHISAVKLPEGVRPTIDDRDFTIATIAAPSGGSDAA